MALVAFCLPLVLAMPLLLYHRWTGLLSDSKTRLAQIQELATDPLTSLDGSKLRLAERALPTGEKAAEQQEKPRIVWASTFLLRPSM